MRINIFLFFLFVFCMANVSAGFFDDIFGGITGHVINEKAEVTVDISNVECKKVKDVFEEKYLDYSIPEAVPFSDEVFNIYIDEVFFVGFELVEKKITEVRCEVLDDVSYNIYVTSDLIEELASEEMGDDVVGIYNEKKKSGELRIEAVGFGKKFKLGLINFGLKIAGWFS